MLKIVCLLALLKRNRQNREANMSGDLQAKRRTKNRSKKKNQILELEKKEHHEEALGFIADSEDEGIKPAAEIKPKRPNPRREKLAKSHDSRQSSSLILRLIKWLIFGLIICGSAAAIVTLTTDIDVVKISSDGLNQIKSHIPPDVMKFLGANCVLPDFQSFQTHFSADSAITLLDSAKARFELLIVEPLLKVSQQVRSMLDGGKQTEEEVHANDDSNDYTPELNEWIRSHDARPMVPVEVDEPVILTRKVADLTDDEDDLRPLEPIIAVSNQKPNQPALQPSKNEEPTKQEKVVTAPTAATPAQAAKPPTAVPLPNIKQEL